MPNHANGDMSTYLGAPLWQQQAQKIGLEKAASAFFQAPFNYRYQAGTKGSNRPKLDEAGNPLYEMEDAWSFNPAFEGAGRISRAAHEAWDNFPQTHPTLGILEKRQKLDAQGKPIPIMEEGEEPIYKQLETIAPFNELHAQAKKAQLDEFARHQSADEYKLARKELDAARRGVKGHHEASAMVSEMMSNPTKFYDKFLNPYQSQVMEDMFEKRRDRWFKEIQPTLTNQAILKGTYATPAHRAHMERVARDYMLEAEREQRSFHHNAAQDALKFAQEHRGQAINSAQVAAQMAMQDRQGHINSAQAYRDQARERFATNTAAADSIREEATREQVQKQKELNEQLRRAYEEYEHPQKMAAQFASIVAGQPRLSEGFNQFIASHIPSPNPYTAAAGALNTMGGHYMKQGQFKKGGKIENPTAHFFRKGGHIPHRAGGGDLPNPLMLNADELPRSKEEIITQEMANRMGKPRNALADYYFAKGAHLTAGIRGKTSEVYPRAAQAGLEAMRHTENANDVNDYRAASLVKSIADSREKQKELLANYQIRKGEMLNTREHYLTTRTETERHNRAMEALRDKEIGSRSETSSKKAFLYDEEGNPMAPRTPTDSKEIAATLDAITHAAKASKSIVDAGEVLAEIETGPVKESLTNPESWYNKYLGNMPMAAAEAFGVDVAKMGTARKRSETVARTAEEAEKRSSVAGLQSRQRSKIGPHLSREQNMQEMVVDSEALIQKMEDGLNRLIVKGATHKEIELAKNLLEDAKEYREQKLALAQTKAPEKRNFDINRALPENVKSKQSAEVSNNDVELRLAENERKRKEILAKLGK
jgi:hypothetical protein